MRPILALTIMCALIPTIAAAQDVHKKAEPAPVVRRTQAPAVVWPPSVLRQDLFDRNNPNNLRHDYPAAPAQPGQF